MTKIICITSGLTGILNASFELVNRLKMEGYDLLYASPLNVKKKVECQGIPYVQLPLINSQTQLALPDFKGFFRKVSKWLYKYKNADTLRKEVLKELMPVEFVDLIEKERPALLIVDVELHEYIIKAYALGTPMLILSQWFSLWKRQGLPYLLHATIPGKGWRGSSWAITLSWKLVALQRNWMFFKRKVLSLGTDRRTTLLALAKQEGFPLEYLKENNWPGPFTYSELPVISMTAAELEFPHSPRPNLFYVGPMVAGNRKELMEGEEVDVKLDEIFELKKSKNLRLIYCSLSTMKKGDHAFLAKLVDAVKDRKDWVLILGMGGLIENTDLGKLPNNVFAFPYVPQLKVLKHADCSVNHGGIHTINECIYFRVPMLIYSGKQSDQNGCAARIEYHGLGIMADKDIDSSADIERKLEKILTESTYMEKCKEMQSECQDYKTNRILEQIVDRYINEEVVVL